MSCYDCKKEATHYHPMHLCDDHYALRYSTQCMPGLCKELGIKGTHIHFLKLFEYYLKKRNLWKEGEEMSDVVKDRCAESVRGSKWLLGNTAKE